MRLPAKLSCALLACMCTLCELSAQTTEGASGRVVDENGEAVAGAYLIAVDPGTSEVLAATASDAEGEYTLPTLPGGFVLNVSCIGYESLDIPVEGGTQGLEAVGTIRMQSVATRIDEAVVTADAPKIERELGRFVMRDVSASPLAKGSSTYNFLKFMPMVNIRPEGGVTVLNRDANIRINGRGIGGMAEQMIKGIPADEIERIEITPTRKSSQSAQSQKATINIVLKQRPDEGVRVVVDSGLQRRPEYDARRSAQRLVTRQIPLSSAEQRRGRAGRTEPGVCVRLWAQASEEGMASHARPEILEADLAGLALDLALWGESRPTCPL